MPKVSSVGGLLVRIEHGLKFALQILPFIFHEDVGLLLLQIIQDMKFLSPVLVGEDAGFQLMYPLDMSKCSLSSIYGYCKDLTHHTPHPLAQKSRKWLRTLGRLCLTQLARRSKPSWSAATINRTTLTLPSVAPTTPSGMTRTCPSPPLPFSGDTSMGLERIQSPAY